MLWLLSLKMLRGCNDDNNFSHHGYGQLHINCYTTTTISQKLADEHYVVISIQWFQLSCCVSQDILLIHIWLLLD